MPSFPKNVFDSGNTFFLGLMGEHRSLNNITNSINTWVFSLPGLVNFNLAEFVSFETSFFKIKSSSEWLSTN
jgi:hypothetical protein